MESQNMVSIKIEYMKEIHRIRVDMDNFTFNNLINLFETTFRLRKGYVIQYRDNEDDLVTVSSDSEFCEAIRISVMIHNSIKSLYFIAKHPSLPAMHICPVVKAMEEFAESIAGAASELVTKTMEQVDKVKEEEWAAKAKDHAKQTGEILQQTAMETHEYLTERSRALSETDVGQKVKEFAGEMRTSLKEMFEDAFPVQRRNQTEETHQPKNHDIAVATVGNETSEAATETVRSSTSEASTETASVNFSENATTTTVGQSVEVATGTFIESPKEQESEWDMVEDAQVEEAQVEEAQVEEAAEEKDDFSSHPTVTKWTSEIGIIMEMLPEAKIADCVDLLEHSAGNVQVVINSLMDL